MKQTLQLRLGQHLTMTPQLQQAIRLLQLSTLELCAEVQEALETNPLLEMVEAGESDAETALHEEDTGSMDVTDNQVTAAEQSASPEAVIVGPEQEADSRSEGALAEDSVNLQTSALPEELPVDTTWDDLYDTGGGVGAASGDGENRGYELADSESGSLQDHLMWQLDMSTFSETDHAVAMAIIDAVNDDGYLSASLEEIHQGFQPEDGIELDEVQAVLHRVQNFDPAGVAARDLQECLMIQLHQLPEDTAFRNEAMRLVRDHLALIGSREYTQLMRRMKMSQGELQNVMLLIQSLNPRPGSAVTSAPTDYVIPDVVVRKVGKSWRVELNTEAVPRLRINAQYASLIRRADNSSDNTYLKGRMQEARWLIKSLQSRNETLLKVASCIVERQQAFLEHGDEAMKALVLHDIAEATGMHESTISRVTTKKYMLTPRGVYELKYFFSSHVDTASGGECSATAIRAFIKKLVAAENGAKPLSDSKIADILAEQGINVARRTVAKYREAMSIPPSNERKRFV